MNFLEVWPREPSDNYYHTARSVPVDRSEVPRLTLGSLKCLLYRPRFRREWQQQDCCCDYISLRWRVGHGFDCSTNGNWHMETNGNFMLIGSKSMIKNISNSHPFVFIKNKQIKQVYESKALGVKTDQNLSWKGNTDEICNKVTAGISAIRRIQPFVDQDTLILIYNATARLRISTITLKYGIHSVKLNQNDCKNYKIEQLK